MNAATGGAATYKCDAGAGEGNDVGPVAMRLGVDHVMSPVHGPGGGQALGQHALLQGEYGVALTDVAATVVQGRRCPARQVHSEREIIVLEWAPRCTPPIEADQSQGAAADDEGHQHQRVDAVLQHLAAPHGIATHPRTVFGDVADQPWHVVGQHLAGGRISRIAADLPGGVGPGLGGGASGTGGGAPKDGRSRNGTGRDLLPGEHRIQDVHGDAVREPGHHQVRQFLGCAQQVQGGADPRTGLRHQRDPPLRHVAFGDIDHDVGYPENPAVAGLEAERGRRIDVFPPWIAGRPPAFFERDRGLTGPEDLAHHLLHLLAAELGPRLGGAQPEDLLNPGAMHPLRRSVEAHQPQLRVHEDQANGRAGEQRLQECLFDVRGRDVLGGRRLHGQSGTRTLLPPSSSRHRTICPSRCWSITSPYPESAPLRDASRSATGRPRTSQAGYPRRRSATGPQPITAPTPSTTSRATSSAAGSTTSPGTSTTPKCS